MSEKRDTACPISYYKSRVSPGPSGVNRPRARLRLKWPPAFNRIVLPWVTSADPLFAEPALGVCPSAPGISGEEGERGESPSRSVQEGFSQDRRARRGGLVVRAAGRVRRARPVSGKGDAFKLKYAPGHRHVRGPRRQEPADQLKFIADQGFSAWFDNGLMGRPAAEQESLAKESTRLGLTIGPSSSTPISRSNPSSPRTRPSATCSPDASRPPSRRASGRAASWTLVVPGRYNESLDWDYQTANVVENLKRLAGAVRALGPRHRPRAAQSQGPPGALPDQDGPGLPDLQGRREPRRSRSSTTCTTSRSPRATSSPTSTPAGTSSPPSTSATRRAGRSRARAR